jgi:uncharacterized protein with NRDE domain
MCLILFAWGSHPDYALVVAANRDEFYERPSIPLNWWPDSPNILAGKDAADVIGSSGTWMGLSTAGKFSALTNIRAPSEKNSVLRTRGELTTHFLQSDLSPQEYIQEKSRKFQQYNGFNLLIGDFSQAGTSSLQWLSNRVLVDGQIKNMQRLTSKSLPAGVYGLSNAMLDTPWPKVTHRVSAFAQTLAMDSGKLDKVGRYLDILNHEEIALDDQLPATGVSLDWERTLSAAFIKTENYGTRASSVLRIRNDGHFQFTEKIFNQYGVAGEVTEEGKLISQSRRL